MRRRLKRVGFTSSFDDLPYLKAEIFTIIDATSDKLDAKEAKRNRKGK